MNTSKKESMQAFQFEKNGPVTEVLKEAEIPVPDVGAGMVRIEVKAVSINPIDAMVMETEGGLSGAGWSMDFPLVPGYDISGVVDEVGDDAAGLFAKGDDVFAVNWGKGKHDDDTNVTAGGLARYAIVPASKLSKKPKEVSHEHAAAVSLVGSTATQALDNLGVKEGSRVLIFGGASAVGVVATQLAKLRGAWVATTCSPRTRDYVAATGKPDLIIDYTSEKWDEMPELKGVDAIFDAIGETDGFARAKSVVKEGGSFLSIVSFDPGFDPTAHQPRFKWAAMYALSNDSSQQDELVRLLADGKLKLDVEETFPFTSEGVQAAFAKQKGGKSKGKNVIVF